MIGFFGQNDFGPVTGRILFSRNTASTSRFQYATQSGYYQTSLSWVDSPIPNNNGAVLAVAYSPKSKRIASLSSTLATTSFQTSDNFGTTWSVSTPFGPYGLTSSATGGKMKYIPELERFFVSVRNSATYSIFYSDDGLTWNRSSHIALTGDAINDFSYSPTLDRVVCCQQITGTGSMYYSNDKGVSWTRGSIDVTPGAASAPRVVLWMSHYNKFISSGDCGSTTNNFFLTSTDGMNWNRFTFSTFTNVTNGTIQISGIYFPNQRRVVFSKFTGVNQTKPWIYSDDGGTTWVEPTVTNQNYRVRAAVYSPDTETAYWIDNDNTRAYTSQTGASWTQFTPLATGAAAEWIENPPQYTKTRYPSQ